MNIVRTIMSAVPMAFGYCCLATAIVQAGGGLMMWSQGKLGKDKALRYAAIAYGLDVTELPPEDPPDDAEEPSDDELTHDQLLAKRVDNDAILADRKLAMRQEADRIRSLEKELKSERDRRAMVRQTFRAYLDGLEKQVVAESLKDVQRTLESLSPRQAKDIILRSLQDEGLDEGDDVVNDIVSIIKAMPESKLKKILGEFKTDVEQEQLHQILLEIGEFEEAERLQ